MQTSNFRQLSKAQQALIRVCQRINYGSILNVQVSDGDACFVSSSEIVMDIKLDEGFAHRRELDLDDFDLPVESRRLLGRIESMKNGVIEKIVVHDGIPRRVILRGLHPEVSV